MIKFDDAILNNNEYTMKCGIVATLQFAEQILGESRLSIQVCISIWAHVIAAQLATSSCSNTHTPIYDVRHVTVTIIRKDHDH